MKPSYIIGTVPLKPPQRFMSPKRIGRWATDGHWMLLTSTNERLLKLPADHLPREAAFDELFVSVRDSDGTLPPPDFHGLCEGTPCYGFSDKPYLVRANYYNWVIARLGLELGEPENPRRPMLILDGSEAIGLLMPYEGEIEQDTMSMIASKE